MQWLESQFNWLLIQDKGSLLLALLGWPVVVLSMLLAISGVYFLKPRLLLIAAVLVLPMSFYLSGANNWIAIVAPLIPASLVISWYTTRRKLLFMAWPTMVFPYVIFMYLAC